jgi:tetratricopeptide (TPR) repeat protein
MMISWVAMERIAEKEAASNPKYRKLIAKGPLRSDARILTDRELLAKLRAFGIDLDRSRFGQLCDKALSAEEVAGPLMERRAVGSEGDWIWICIAALWQRWLPVRPCFEMLDDKIQAGYEAMEAQDVVAACRIWLDAWTDVLRILDKAGFSSISEFDESFRGTQSLFNWIQDLEDELWSGGLLDRQFLVSRIALCEESARRFEASDDQLLIENRRRALAESYFELGETAKTEGFYREWLKNDPQWGWGWIGWSDRYRFTRTQSKDLKRSERLLLEGLAVADVRDSEDISERLADLYQDQGRMEEAVEIQQRAQIDSAAIRHTLELQSGGKVLRQKTTITFPEEGLPLDELPNAKGPLRLDVAGSRQKVGRNQPCPCGSGKKFKKCCGGAARGSTL